MFNCGFPLPPKSNIESVVTLRLFLTCYHFRVTEQPLKIPFVAAIVLVVNSQKSEIAAEVLSKVGEALQGCINSGSWRDVKLLLRFLGCLQGLLEGEGVFQILEELFSRAVDLQTASSEDVRFALLTVGLCWDWSLIVDYSLLASSL